MREHTAWLYSYSRNLVRSQQAAQDVVQETFYLAYKSFQGYSDLGRERAWLASIARNAARRYYGKNERYVCISLDTGGGGGLYDFAFSPAPSPEEEAMRHSLTDDILRMINALPPRQRSVVYCRYIVDMSVSETARVLDIPEATVKSNAYYGLRKLRGQLALNETPPSEKAGALIMPVITPDKGASDMNDCKDIYGLLLQYARGFLGEKERADIAEHGKSCAVCAHVIKSLSALNPYLERELTEEDSYFSINFQLSENEWLAYSGFSNPFTEKQCAELNETLKSNGYKLPESQVIIGCGHDADLEHLSEFTNEGGKVEFDLDYQSATHVRVLHKTMPAVYRQHWIYSVYYAKRSMIYASKDAPGLYIGYGCNNLGKAAKCGIFMPLEDGAVNVRIKKGSGTLDFDGVVTPYSQRYTSEEEKIELSFTYNK